MHLEKLRLVNFKNYSRADLMLNEEINCFVGENGAGKTNLLDAVHYLSLTKSFHNSIDVQNMKHGSDFFSLLGEFIKNGNQYKVKCQMKKGDRKVFSVNGKAYDKISEHIGLFPVVLISPDDTDIIRGSNDIRRKFIDGVMAQMNAEYLQLLIRYNHALRQRNSFLKQIREQPDLDKDLIDHYDHILIRTGQKIFTYRMSFIKDFSPVVRHHYEDISGGKERVDIQYRSDQETDNFEIDLKRALKKDIAYGRTTLGIHRDEYRLIMDGHPMKKFGSQGQHKSMIIALKLAQFDFLREKNKFKPILLLDDIFDKLDENRINKIMNRVAGHEFGQIFLTDARPERTYSIFRSIKSGKNVFMISDGAVNPAEDVTMK